MRYLLVIYRFIFFCVYTARIVAEVYWQRVWLRARMQRVMAVRRRWANKVLAGVGVRASVEGIPPEFPCLYLANHRSYLDPILLLRQIYAYPVAKSELASWPLIGKGARWAGILYVQRERDGSRVSTLKAIADTVLERKCSVILFPEGTTSGLPGMLPLKKGAFRTAAKWDLPVVPVAICFENTDDFWVGKTTFIQHAWKRFQDKTIRVTICYGPVTTGKDSDALEQEARQWIEQKLQQFPAVLNPA
ncbi:MAG: 1-acyl-sn-glycerol-3-phosphate acyltransferase [Saprospirales bacterium]|nr:1-acyl-sn-glycerol-3-phosphate acyltransferase [Saprospirales bacterium]MBK8922920.1 1-acyl-sn-glycerol-3-phosphate acyltransferase [Saprospirales bacterium]